MHGGPSEAKGLCTRCMKSIGRKISLLARKLDFAKDRRRVLRQFSQWKAALQQLPSPQPRSNRLLLIRLDDIGDYLLFRNQLEVYKRSLRWSAHRITLLGNESWRDLFTLLDGDTVDETIWVNKNRYLFEPSYRFEIWSRLRGEGFETVVAPSRTRPLLLDDLCALASAPLRSLGHANTHVSALWNHLSDSAYSSIFKSSSALMHEFQFNAEFAEWASGTHYDGSRPRIVLPTSSLPMDARDEPYVICFAGASTRSKRWPVNRWIDFIKLHRRNSGVKLVFAGHSKPELEMVQIIQRRTGAESIAGTVTLIELMHWVAGAQAVVTNDTMAAHLGASLGTPTVIIANGVNYMRFSEYLTAGMNKVATVYPEVVNRRRSLQGDGPYAYHETVSADIASIRAVTVFGVLQGLLMAP
jgi:ADP-heptose:LPS heptosyltransferase